MDYMFSETEGPSRLSERIHPPYPDARCTSIKKNIYVYIYQLEKKKTNKLCVKKKKSCEN